jgi:hypothetical protein
MSGIVFASFRWVRLTPKRHREANAKPSHGRHFACAHHEGSQKMVVLSPQRISFSTNYHNTKSSMPFQVLAENQ